MLVNLQKLFDQAEAQADRDTAAKRVRETALRLITDAKAQPEPDDPEQARSIRYAHAWSRLILADVAIAQGDMEEALKQHFNHRQNIAPILFDGSETPGHSRSLRAGRRGPVGKIPHQQSRR